MANSSHIDPLGRVIILHDHTWFGHIIEHHPDMVDHRDLVEGTMVNPLEIRFSAADADCRIYFGVGPRRGIMITVVVDIVGGFVKTAHQVKTAKGNLEWSRQMQ